MRFSNYAGILALCLAGVDARAAIDVPSGASMDLADGAIHLACSDLTVAGTLTGGSAMVSGIANLTINGGTLDAGSALFAVGGDFVDSGTFNAGTSSVEIVDACGSGVSRLGGSSAFYDFSASTAAGKQLVLDAGLTQSVSHAFTLQGAAGQLLRVLSSGAGQQARFAIAAAASQVVSYVDARDNLASQATIAPGLPSLYNSIDSGNLTNWFGSAGTGDPGSTGRGPVPTPALGPFAAILLAFLLGWFGWRKRDA
ncbi:MAG: hypothetical protein QM741_12645 [Rudaea sp.]|uniref:hypothetical protein n=1 Tax=Rudaea sp. TaxID=2136325 RepID=UPI0039E509F0